MIANEYGEAQLKKWRRGFKIRPPPVSSYSFNYPGNDYKRTKYVKDIPISLSETINRSIEARKFQVHRKFPKTESLWDCVSNILNTNISNIIFISLRFFSCSQMQRSIPFYTQRIVPEAVNKGKRVLVTSHENAIRGILMVRAYIMGILVNYEYVLTFYVITVLVRDSRGSYEPTSPAEWRTSCK